MGFSSVVADRLSSRIHFFLKMYPGERKAGYVFRACRIRFRLKGVQYKKSVSGCFALYIAKKH